MQKHSGWERVRPLQGNGERTHAPETFGSAQASGSVTALPHSPLSHVDSGFTDTVPFSGGSFLWPLVHPSDTTFLLGRDSVLWFANQMNWVQIGTSQPAVCF